MDLTDHSLQSVQRYRDLGFSHLQNAFSGAVLVEISGC